MTVEPWFIVAMVLSLAGYGIYLAGLRRHFSGYFRGLPGASALRGELAALKEASQVEERLLALADQADSLAA